MSTSFIYALVDAQPANQAEYVMWARWWLNEASRTLSPDLWNSLQDSLPLGEPREWSGPLGRPHGVWASILVLPREGAKGPSGHRVFSSEAFEWMLENISARPGVVRFHLRELDANGVPVEHNGSLTVSVESVEDGLGWVQFAARSSTRDADLRLLRVSDRWAGVVRNLADNINPSYGHICDDVIQDGSTALDQALRGRGIVRSVTGGRNILRGYSWVTICPRELAEELGGTSSLAATGAFTVVEELRHGGIWLQATEGFSDYDANAVRRVFKAFAPVLPDGKPKPNPFSEYTPRLVWDDAAIWR